MLAWNKHPLQAAGEASSHLLDVPAVIGTEHHVIGLLLYFVLSFCRCAACCEVFPPWKKNDHVLLLCLCSTLAVSRDHSFQSFLVVMPTVYLRQGTGSSERYLHSTDGQTGTYSRSG